MDEKQILQALSVGEDTDWEFKSAKGGVPGSLWETYSGMANTDGGTIVLGVSQHGNTFAVDGLDDPSQTKKNFWDTINNRGKVSANLLSDEQAVVQEVAGKKVFVIQVPRASRRQRPVYVGQNPLDGTYRRNYEGDYKCRPEGSGPNVGRPGGGVARRPHLGAVRCRRSGPDKFAAVSPAVLGPFAGSPLVGGRRSRIFGEARGMASGSPQRPGRVNRGRAADVRQGRGDS